MEIILVFLVITGSKLMPLSQRAEAIMAYRQIMIRLKIFTFLIIYVMWRESCKKWIKSLAKNMIQRYMVMAPTTGIMVKITFPIIRYPLKMEYPQKTTVKTTG
jgi:hypothetical protein